MTTNKNNKHTITDQLVWIRQLPFAQATFLWLSKFSVIFNISSSHFNTNLRIRHVSQEHLLISKYSSILHALLHSQSHVLGFLI